MGALLHEIKSLSDQEEEGRYLKVRNQTLTPSFLVFGFGEKPYLCVKCSWMVLVQFEVVLHCFD